MLELDARFLFFHSDINRHCKFAIAESLASMGRNKKGYNWKARQVVKTEVVNEKRYVFALVSIFYIVLLIFANCVIFFGC